MTHARQHRNKRGTSTIEFILVLPTLVFILFTIVELSRMWLTFDIATTAVREGARVGVVTNPFDPAPATARINSILTAANMTPTSVSVICVVPCQPGSVVRADVTLTFSTLFPIMLPMLTSLPMQQSASMRYE